MLLFIYTLCVSGFTIYTFIQLFKIPIKMAFFLFFPLYILYLTSISFFLSFTSHLTDQHFLLVSTILCSITLIYGIHKKVQFPFKYIAKQITHIQLSTPTMFIGIIYCVVLIILSGLLRSVTPTLSADDVGYRATAPMQWIQSRSLFRSESISEHGNVLLYATGVIYMFPFLFSVKEHVATLFYWLAFPIILIELYVLIKKLSKNHDAIPISLLLCISAPILYRNVTAILIHETWLGISLIACMYALLDIIKRKEKRMTQYIFLGLSLGVLPLIKATGWWFCAFLLLFSIKYVKKFIFPILAGIVISISCSGYITMLYQNYQLYGTPGGTTAFTSIHTASFSTTQIVTHIIRLPFLFIKYPCYTRSCQGLNPYLQPLARMVGATKELPNETALTWIGSYNYLSDPDRNYGFGGILWLILIILSLKDMFKALINRQKLSIETHLLILFSLTIIGLIVFVRWEDASGVPYKHLIGAYIIACAFFYRVLHWIQKNLLVYTIVLILLLISTIPLVKQTVTSIYLWYTHEKNRAIENMNLEPVPFGNDLEQINSPSTFLFIEPSGVPHYAFYFHNGMRKHSIYQFSSRHDVLDANELHQLSNQIVNKKINYVILPKNSPLRTWLRTQIGLTPKQVITTENGEIELLENNTIY